MKIDDKDKAYVNFLLFHKYDYQKGPYANVRVRRDNDRDSAEIEFI